jgi:hypothetical protein
LINFATSKNLSVKSRTFPHHNIHKYTTYNQIDHILIDGQGHSNVLDVQSYRAGYCDTDHYLVVAKVRERLVVNKQRSHRILFEEVQSQEAK